MIEKKEWEIQEGVVIPYYFDSELSERFEKILPHENLTLNGPNDTAIRGITMPFGVLCVNLGYGGLDKNGYETLGNFIKNDSNDPDRFFIGEQGLDNLLKKQIEEPLPLLLTKKFEGINVYFPTGAYVLENK